VYDGDLSNQQPQLVAVPADEQWQAVEALIKTLDPEVLAIPQSVLEMIPPKPIGYNRSRESFPLRTAQGIDYLAIAETAADHTVQGLLQHQRLTRMNNQHGRDSSLPSVTELMDRLLDASYYSTQGFDQSANIQRAVQNVLLYRMMALVRNDGVDNQVKAQVNLSLHGLLNWLNQQLGADADSQWKAHHQLAADEINNWFERGSISSLLSAPLPMPPGAPI